MIKKVLCLIFLFIFCQANAERWLGPTNYYFGGYRVRPPSSPGDNFGEFIFGKLNQNGFSFQLKTGLGNFIDSRNSTIYVGGAVNGSGSFHYTADGAYLKVGWIAGKAIHRVFSTYVSFNDNITLTQHTLRHIITDRVYGGFLNEYKSTKLYPFTSLEVETCHMLTIARRVDFHLAYYLGYVVQRPDLFTDALDGFGKVATFVPGATFRDPVYFNVQLGVSIHLY